MNLIRLLPDELIIEIIHHTDSKAKRAFSMVDHRTHALVLNAIRCIRLFPPSRRFSFDHHPSDIPEDILVKVIRRYPNLNKIIFGH